MSSSTATIQQNKSLIPFNKPFLTGHELKYIESAVASGKISGNGVFTKKCQNFFETRYGFHKTLLTSSCTDALEMAAILLDLKSGDEVIIPSYTFVSTANAFILRGAKVVFADSCPDNPNIDASKIESLITPKTKAIVVVHYGGVACDMDAIMETAKKHNLIVVEDAAHAIESFYHSKEGLKPLGGIGHLATFSFHETKNIICGEGGMLVINDPAFVKRAEIIWEKGTNRAAFARGEVHKYHWVDIGSSFLPSEVSAAFLFAQLEHLEEIQARRCAIWKRYFSQLSGSGAFAVPQVPKYATVNGHLFYILCNDTAQRDELLGYLKDRGVLAVFHYLPLHESPFYGPQHQGGKLPNSIAFAGRLIRLPLYFELSDQQIDYIASCVEEFFAGSQATAANV